MIPWRATNLWIHAVGELKADAFAEAVQGQFVADGRNWEPRRWFTDEEELLHHGGQTWCHRPGYQMAG